MKLAEYKETIQQPLRQATLCFLIRGNEVLLAMKKRGFGEGRWNGVGGKPNDGETIDVAAVRETREEIAVILKNIKRKAYLDFYFPPNPDWNKQVVVYTATDWEGEPQETDEMQPKWFSIDEMPFDFMWPDDKHWLPHVLGGSNLKAEFLFGENDVILDFNVRKVESLSI